MKCKHSMRLASALIASTVSLAFSGPLFGAPKDVYVTTTGAGDMDGRDWDNAMFNITAAYALCAANADGGTVHLAGGVYRSTGWDATLGNFTQNAAIVPASNVTLRGSDDKDDPTILTGDCTLDNEWYTGNVKKQWQDGKLVEPEEDAHTYSIPNGEVNDTLFCTSSAAIENCRFEHLIFHGFTGKDWSHWVSNTDNAALRLSNAANTVFDSCRFVGMDAGIGQLGVAALSLSDMTFTVTNCTFVANRTGIIATAAAETAVKISDCLFRAGHMTGSRSNNCALRLESNVCVVLENSVFRYNYSYASSCIDANTLSQPITVRNTVFEHCICDQAQSARTICNVNKGGTFDSCLFVSNSVTVTGGGTANSAAILASDSCRLYNCYFGYNALTKGASSTADASVLASTGSFGHTLVNCTVESNRVEGSTNPCTIGGYRCHWLSIANCVFRNNDCVDANGVRQREFRNVCLESQTYYPSLFVNTIVWNDATDYIPFVLVENDTDKRIGVASCDIRNYTPAAAVSGTGFLYKPILDEEPMFAENTKSVGTRRARPLTARNSSDIRNKAVKVCQANTGDFYFLDQTKSPNQWRKIDAKDNTTAALSVLTLAQGETIGLTPDMQTYADIFGAPRRAKASMGPLDANQPGLVLSFR